MSNLKNRRLYESTVKIAGWSKSNSTVFNPILRTANVQVLSNTECTQRVQELTNHEVYLDSRQAFCTFADPFVVINGVSIFFPIKTFSLLQNIFSKYSE
jgi:hypothetical protein